MHASSVDFQPALPGKRVVDGEQDQTASDPREHQAKDGQSQFVEAPFGLGEQAMEGGMVLGVQKHAEYTIDQAELKEGDCLLFCTDGLIDAADFNGEFWGRENLLETAKLFVKESAENMIKNILAFRRRFVGLARQFDDTSIVVVKINKTSEP